MADAYYVEAEDLRILQTINRRLYGDGTHLTPDDRRDLANLLAVVLVRVERMPVEETA